MDLIKIIIYKERFEIDIVEMSLSGLIRMLLWTTSRRRCFQMCCTIFLLFCNESVIACGILTLMQASLLQVHNMYLVQSIYLNSNIYNLTINTIPIL